METLNDLVGYSNLKIFQNDEWFKFSLESVLLPNFVTLNLKDKEILDLCTGNAPIPLILSTKTKAHITGVEIQEDIYNLAKKSVLYNKLENRISLINDNLNNLKKLYPSDYFDLITVNPPYFKNLELSSKNINEHKTIARHEITTNIEEIAKISSYLLKNGGRFALVHRTERLFEIIEIVRKYKLIPKKIQMIYPKENKESNLFMLECIKNGKLEVKFFPPLYVHNEDGTYKEEIKKIFKIN